jgi:hypothetical protein
MTIKRMVGTVVAAVLLAVGVFVGLVQPAQASGGKGQVCNYGTVTVRLTVDPNNGHPWVQQSLGPNQCSSFGQDVEAIWGRKCSSTSGSCWYNGWKVGFSRVDIRDVYRSPVLPGGLSRLATLWSYGDDYWLGSYVPLEWQQAGAVPALSSIGYDLTR